MDGVLGTTVYGPGTYCQLWGTPVNRLVAEHFGPKGKPKRRFASIEEAARFRAATTGMKRKRIYQCTVCDSWHLGGTRG